MMLLGTDLDALRIMQRVEPEVALRDRTFARQKELGVIPYAAELTPRSAGIPAWEDMSDAIKPVLAREIEVLATMTRESSRVVPVVQAGPSAAPRPPGAPCHVHGVAHQRPG
jgi:hypothetical protein